MNVVIISGRINGQPDDVGRGFACNPADVDPEALSDYEPTRWACAQPASCAGSATEPDTSDPNTTPWSAMCPECHVIIRINEAGSLFVHEPARR